MNIKEGVKNWSPEIPDKEGYYWVYYKDKHQDQCVEPCEVTIFNDGGKLVSGRLGVMTHRMLGKPGWKEVRFGPEIPLPF